METGIVYKWVNNLNGKWYSGSHKGDGNDNYKASGIAINRAFDKYGIDNFTRHIIYEGPDYRLVEELHLKSNNASKDKMSYNMKDTSIGGFTPGVGIGNRKGKTGYKHTQKAKDAISASSIGRNVGNSRPDLSERNKMGITGGQKKKTIINGITYESRGEAMRALGIWDQKLRSLLRKEANNE